MLIVSLEKCYNRWVWWNIFYFSSLTNNVTSLLPRQFSVITTVFQRRGFAKIIFLFLIKYMFEIFQGGKRGPRQEFQNSGLPAEVRAACGSSHWHVRAWIKMICWQIAKQNGLENTTENVQQKWKRHLLWVIGRCQILVESGWAWQ